MMYEKRMKGNGIWKKQILLCLFIFLTTEFTCALYAQQVRTVSGNVRDVNGELLIGVSVVVKGNTSVGTTTDLDGKYTINIPTGGKVLVFSYVGMETQEVPISGNTLDVVLTEKNTGLDEVVVVAYGKQKKATVTGAVASVQTKDLLQSPQANIGNALVGRMPGLTAVQQSGEPGKDQATIRIRGIGSFAGGVDPLIMIDGVETPNYNNLDPNEIENVTILKDASATAVYGVRGANGVILITTKRGTVGKPQVSVSANFAMQNFANLREPMNAYDWARSYNEAMFYDGYITGNYGPKFSAEEIQKFKDHSDPIFYPDTDWMDIIFSDFTTQSQYNINLNGGTDKVRYFVSLGYFGQDGMYNNTDMLSGYNTQTKFRRYNLRSNLDFQVTKDFSISIKLADQLSNRNAPSDRAEYILAQSFYHPPTSGPGIVDGKIIDNLTGRYNFSPNPITSLVQGHGNVKEYQNQLTGSIEGVYKLDKLTKGLSVRAMLSYQNYNMHTIRYVKDAITYKAVRNEETGEAIFLPQGQDGAFSVNETFGKNRKVYMEAGVNYSRSFGSHNVGALLLYNQSKYYSPDLAYLVPNGYQGIVGRVTYDYKNKYLAEVNVGYNGTENFAKGKRFGLFPAYSLGWVVSEEGFFPKTDWVSFLKIRGSYGEVGNDKIGGERFLYMPTAYLYYSGTSVNYDTLTPQYNLGTVGQDYTNYLLSAEGKIGNPDLTWERAVKMNIGFDMVLWGDRIKITADVFNESRKNILTTRSSLPVIVGADMPAYNLGKMKNYGFDGEITFRDKIGKFNYWIKGLYTFARNEIVEMDEVEPVYEYQRRTGQRYNQYFGLIAEGFFNTWEEVNDVNRPVYEFQNNKIQPGDVKYKDVNGDGKINSFDMVPIGYSDFPEVSFGISFGADYKGFDFSVLFSGATNVSLRASKTFRKGFMQEGGAIDYLKDYSWTPERYAEGAEIKFPHLAASDAQVSNYQESTLWIRDASYLRLKNAEIGYSFTGEYMKKLGLQSARIYLNGNNLLTWSNLFPGEDPEIPSYSDGNYEPYPIVRTFNIGVNVKF